MKTEKGGMKYPYGRVIRFLPSGIYPDMPKTRSHTANHERFRRDELKAVKPDALESKKNN